MSLFLGKIHYWLFNKVLWFEGLEDEIIQFANDNGIDIDKLKAEINFKYGQKLPEKNLEEMIDTSNIHGWLQDKINSAEGRMAAWINIILNNNNDYILDGMPCDRVNEIITSSEQSIMWRKRICVHKDIWEGEGISVDIFYKLREEWINAFVNEIDNSYEYIKSEDNIQAIRKRI